ncbi:MAG: sugar ABC transporter ATP-binding protein [Thermoprotei archaeon]|nr:MAG: sugar ABC transporter ATP-binding protein [Thermoprotei archaeon]
MVEIRLEEVTKRFGNVLAVDRITLKVRDKEFIVLLGPSGCGKTTTLRLIAGLEKVTSGRIYFGDELVDDGKTTYVAPQYRNVSMVFQSYALFPHMNVFENIAFPARIRKLPKEEVKKRVYELAELLRIKDLLDRKPHELSGGQQQRVALARALMIEPSVLLLDEPLANLDAKLRVYMRAELKRLQKEFKCTTIYVTHDQVEAMSMADRIVVMNQGRIQQVGTPDDLYNKPANLFVAGFIGSPPMNFLECSIDGKGFLDFGVFKLRMPEDWITAVQEVGEVIYGIRPQDIRVYKKEREGAVEFTVYVAEPLGDRIVLTLARDNLWIKALAPPEFTVEMGDRVWISFDFTKAHLFDKRSERLII